MKKYGIIYLIRNKVNGKMYIGQTIEKKGFKGRYKQSGKGIERVYNHHKYNKDNNRSCNKHLLCSIDKYGFEAFEVDEEFDVAYSKEELDKLESLYIDIYQTRNRDYGYNDKGGGANGKHSEETKQKIGNSKKVENLSEETRKRLSLAKQGELNPNYGKTLSEKTRQKISKENTGKKRSKEQKQHQSQLMKGRKLTEEHKQKISERHVKCIVYCEEFKEIRYSIKEWADELGLDRSSITKCCKNKLKSTHNYHFHYATQEEIEEYLKQQNKDNNDVA